MGTQAVDLGHAELLQRLRAEVERHLLEQERIVSDYIGGLASQPKSNEPTGVPADDLPLGASSLQAIGGPGAAPEASGTPPATSPVSEGSCQKDEQFNFFLRRANDPSSSVSFVANTSFESMRQMKHSSPKGVGKYFNWGNTRSWIAHEPERRGILARLVGSPAFELVALLVIVINGMFIVWTTNQGMVDVHSAKDSDSSVLDGTDSTILAVECAFLAYYITEFALKLAVHKQYLFCNTDMWWNIFDFVILIISVVDLSITLISIGNKVGAGTGDVDALRTFRIFKIAKTFRMFRALHFVSELRLLMDCVIGSLSSLFWCMMLLVFILSIFAIFLVQSVTGFMTDIGGDQKAASTTDVDLKELQERFGSVQAAMLSLFEAISGGQDWGYYYGLIGATGRLGAAIFIGFILFFSIAAWNIVAGMFLEKAITLGQPDVDTQMLTKSRQDWAAASELLDIVKDIDVDQSGTISLEEFMDYMGNPRFRAFFEMRDLDIKDAEMFFRMLTAITNTNELDINTFVSGCMRMRGYANAIDLHTVAFEIKVLHLNQQQIFARIDAELQLLRQLAGAGAVAAGAGAQPREETGGKVLQASTNTRVCVI